MNEDSHLESDYEDKVNESAIPDEITYLLRNGKYEEETDEDYPEPDEQARFDQFNRSQDEVDIPTKLHKGNNE